ncbi:hypothetical protein D3C73_1082220 [compost metagenome]
MLTGHILQMMGLIDDKMLVGGKQLMAGLYIGEQLGMIRNDHIGNACFMLGPVVIAFAEPRAGTAQTGVGITGDGLPVIAAASAQVQLLVVARLRLGKPDDHLRGGEDFFSGTHEVPFIYFMFKLAQTQIVPSSFEDCSLERKRHHFRQ